VDKYDVERDVWTEEDQFPQLTQFRVAHGAVATADGDLFVMGGSAKASQDFGPGLYEMEVLRTEETETGEVNVKSPWSMVSSMGTGRSYLSSAEVDGRIFVVCEPICVTIDAVYSFCSCLPCHLSVAEVVTSPVTPYCIY